MIVIDKPAGLVVHPGAGNLRRDARQRAAGAVPRDRRRRRGRIRPGIVHRLDAGSSGLLVVARTQDAADALIEQFADHSATRRYDALVWGVPDAPHGIIDAPIGRDRGDPLKMAVVANGRFARTDYRVIGTYSAPAVVSRLECRLETGRTHQIRVHLASIGHPLVGDPTYAQRRPMLGLDPPVPARRRTRLRPPGDRRAGHVPQPARRRPRGLARRRHAVIRHVAGQHAGAGVRSPNLSRSDGDSSTGIDLKVGVPAASMLCQRDEDVGLGVVGAHSCRPASGTRSPGTGAPRVRRRRRRPIAGRPRRRRGGPRAARSSGDTNTTRRPSWTPR